MHRCCRPVQPLLPVLFGKSVELRGFFAEGLFFGFSFVRSGNSPLPCRFLCLFLLFDSQMVRDVIRRPGNAFQESDGQHGTRTFDRLSDLLVRFDEHVEGIEDMLGIVFFDEYP